MLRSVYICDIIPGIILNVLTVIEAPQNTTEYERGQLHRVTGYLDLGFI